MKQTITNTHPVPMEVLAHRRVLEPGETLEIDVPEPTAPAPKPEAPKKTASGKGAAAKGVE